MVIIGAILAGLAMPSHSQPSFDPKPWLADLDQMRTAFATRYANLEWAVFDHQADLNDYFQRARARILRAQDAGSARAAFDGLIRRLGDGHVEIQWPAAAMPQASTGAETTCEKLGYDSEKSARPLAALAAGYRPLRTSRAAEFPAGIIDLQGKRIGVLKIGLFSPQGTPSLCLAALQALSIGASEPCDQVCGDGVDRWAHARMTKDLMAQIEALKAARISVLLIDIAGNGGGSEWTEAAARMVTGASLHSERMDFVRGPQWTKEFSDTARKLREAAATALAEDRPLLLHLAAEAEAKRDVANTPCDSALLWSGKRPGCHWLGEGFYGSGVLDVANSAALRGKPWASLVFTPMEYPYAKGVWRGPLLVLVDGNTWSAAEEFAAVLQDNHAAIILGEPTGGAGCGHTDGSAPVLLKNSGGQLELPDCARIRSDGSNEVRGIEPDILAGFRRADGPAKRNAAFLRKLPAAIASAETLTRLRHRTDRTAEHLRH